jgi:hypothetical protein
MQVGDAMTDDECNRLNISLLFLELIIDSSDEQKTEIKDLAWAAHSYIQSIVAGATLPNEDARSLYSKLQTSYAINEARKKLD